jgi:serine/threonine protein kinase
VLTLSSLELDFLHKRGIVHRRSPHKTVLCLTYANKCRDVKPGNVLVNTDTQGKIIEVPNALDQKWP